MDAYFEAKQRLFESPKFAVLNHDDKYSALLRAEMPRAGTGAQVLTYGLGEGADVRASRISSDFQGLRFELHHGGKTHEVESRLVGEINVYNILAAWSAARTLDVAPEIALRGIAACAAVPGRLERIDEGQPFLVIVDYAHTDDALRNAISIARGMTAKRVITLFGCGGDRDRAKRPLMGMAAAENSDVVVLTSDNPRSEDPLGIMNDALVGVRRFDTELVIEPDRERAIRRAIEKAGPGDIVLIAGKGHETYQTLRDKTIPFDDREVARRLLRGFGYGKPKEG